MDGNVFLLSGNDESHKLEALGEIIERWLSVEDDLRVHHTHDLDGLTQDAFKMSDLCILSLTMNSLSAEQETALVSRVSEGKPVLALHSATVYKDGNSRYVDMLGAKFAEHPKYQEFPVIIADSTHPISAGLQDFTVADELYLLDREPAGAKLLAFAVWEGKPRPMVYVRHYGEGRVAYIALGHDEKAWNHPSFKQLVVEAVRWLPGFSED